jgi:hypothetical protein
MQAFVCMLVLEMAHGWHGKSACWRLKQKSDQHQSSELGDDPMSNMIRQIMALFDEYQSKENAKHTLRAMKENARQGFWNGALRQLAIASLSITPPGAENLRQPGSQAHESGGYRRDHLRALAQRVEVDAKAVRIME